MRNPTTPCSIKHCTNTIGRYRKICNCQGTCHLDKTYDIVWSKEENALIRQRKDDPFDEFPPPVVSIDREQPTHIDINSPEPGRVGKPKAYSNIEKKPYEFEPKAVKKAKKRDSKTPTQRTTKANAKGMSRTSVSD